MGRKPIQFSQDELDSIVRMYEDGMPIGKIAVRIGHGAGTVHRILHEEGVRMRPTGMPLETGRNKKILKKSADGMTDTQIADELGMTRQRVEQIRKRGY